MSIPASLRKEIAESTRLIDLGQESYVSLSKKFNGVEVSTIYDIHQEMLAKDELKDLQGEIGTQRKEHDILDGEIAARKEEIQRLKGERQVVAEAFKSQGLTWQAGVRLAIDKT